MSAMVLGRVDYRNAQRTEQGRSTAQEIAQSFIWFPLRPGLIAVELDSSSQKT
jgi:hypothetical protein